MSTQFAHNGDIQIAYETLGNPEHETVIFISGLGSQLVYWTDELCQRFLDRDLHLIRFDNRDVGLTSKTPGQPPLVEEVMQQPDFAPPYTISDMAKDTVCVLDAVGIEKAHIVGVSMGGMIAQTIALEFPERVKTLTSIMSAPSPGTAISEDESERDDEAISASLTMDMSDPETYVDLQLEGYRVTSGPHFDPAYQREIIQRSFERAYHPDGWSYQMMAVYAGGDRTERLSQLSLPSLIIHGALDPLIPPSGGEATAAAIPNAKLIIIDDMGHNLPRPRWNEIADAVKQLTLKA